jgi:hypothetical protein
MHGRHQHHHHEGCHEPRSYGQSGGGPAYLYGYCHDSGQMRMMNYPDYVNNMQTTYSNLYSGMTQPYVNMMQGLAPAAPTVPQGERGRHHRHGDCGCGCHDRHEGDRHECHDCHCSCCVRCADALEYARCGEVRRIPITFENETRRERDVKLQLAAFATDNGTELGWATELSETEFKIPPCGEKTVIITVTVDCGKVGGTTGGGTTVAGQPGDTRQPAATVDSCKVAYATLRAEGCMIRPLVIAVAVLPNDCGAHHAGCQCGCCC